MELVLVSALAFAATSFGQDASAPPRASAGETDFHAPPPLALTAANYEMNSAADGIALGDLRFGALSSPGSAAGLAPLFLGADDSGGGRLSDGYVDAKLGALWFEDDLEDLDVGLLAEVAFGRRFLPFLGVELYSGYVWGEDSEGATDGELWGIPFGVNAKFFIPIPIVEPYAGVGIGGWWLNFEVDSPLGDDDDDDVVFGGSIFVGAHVTLGPVFAGLEGRYLQTEDAEVLGDEIALKGWAALASVGLEF